MTSAITELCKSHLRTEGGGGGWLTDIRQLYKRIDIWAGYWELSEVCNSEKRICERVYSVFRDFWKNGLIWLKSGNEWEVKVRDKE